MTERVMVIVAHPGDEVLGCGGTIARHVADGDEVHVLFVADGETSRTIAARPNLNFMAFEASKVLGTRPPSFLNFTDHRLDQVAFLDVVQLIATYNFTVWPSIVYTHHAGDVDLDHRIVHQAAMTALRPLPQSKVRAIYAFEVLSSTECGTGFAPNHFVDIDIMAGDRTAIGKKWAALACYETEMPEYPHPRCADAISALTASRGFACGRYEAEAFMTLRTIR